MLAKMISRWPYPQWPSKAILWCKLVSRMSVGSTVRATQETQSMTQWPLKLICQVSVSVLSRLRYKGQATRHLALLCRAKSLLDAISNYRQTSTLQNSRLFAISRSPIGKSTRSSMANWPSNSKFMAPPKQSARIQTWEMPCSVLSFWLKFLL